MSQRALFCHVPDPNKLVRCGVCRSEVQRQFVRKLPSGVRECAECQKRYAALIADWKHRNRGNRRHRRAAR